MATRRISDNEISTLLTGGGLLKKDVFSRESECDQSKMRLYPMPKKIARRRYICPKALIQACSLSASRAILGHVLRRVARAVGTLSLQKNAHPGGSKTWTPFGIRYDR